MSLGISGVAGLTEDRRREEKRVLDGEALIVNEDSWARGTDTNTKQTGQTNERQGRSEAEARPEPGRGCGGEQLQIYPWVALPQPRGRSIAPNPSRVSRRRECFPVPWERQGQGPPRRLASLSDARVARLGVVKKTGTPKAHRGGADHPKISFGVPVFLSIGSQGIGAEGSGQGDKRKRVGRVAHLGRGVQPKIAGAVVENRGPTELQGTRTSVIYTSASRQSC